MTRLLNTFASSLAALVIIVLRTTAVKPFETPAV
jgi:hypothetical protein